jgi:hypothetical protein
VSIVNLASDGIPDLWLPLPFIDEAGNGSGQDQSRVDGGRALGFGVKVEKDLASGMLASRLRLPTRLGPLDHHCADRFEGGAHKAISDAIYV